MKNFIYVGVFAAVLATGFFIQRKYDEWFVFPAKRSHVNDQLKDPASTQYRNEFLTKSGWLCGELNSKNGNGGYGGFKKFIAGSSDDAYLESHGYIGKDAGSTGNGDRIIAQLHARTEILKRNIDLYVKTGIHAQMSDYEINEMIIRDDFLKKWEKICS